MICPLGLQVPPRTLEFEVDFVDDAYRALERSTSCPVYVAQHFLAPNHGSAEKS